MHHKIVLGIFSLILALAGCASTTTNEAPVVPAEAATEATAEAAPEAKKSCCSKAKTEGTGCKKPAATNCCAQAKADGKECAKCTKPATEAKAAPAPTR